MDSINRKNRDRRGGHKNTGLTRDDSFGWNDGAFTPVTRAVIKRENKRMARRQHAKAIAEGLSQYDKDVERPRKPWEMTWEEEQEELQHRSRHDYQEYLDGYPDDEGQYDHGLDDDYYFDYPDHLDGMCDRLMNDDIESRRSGYARMDDYVIQHHQVGMTLKEVMSNFLEYR